MVKNRNVVDKGQKSECRREWSKIGMSKRMVKNRNVAKNGQKWPGAQGFRVTNPLSARWSALLQDLRVLWLYEALSLSETANPQS
jgi:hypothetical protein